MNRFHKILTAVESVVLRIAALILTLIAIVEIIRKKLNW